MTRTLCIDPGSCLGWAVFEGKRLLAAGQIDVPKDKQADEHEDRWRRFAEMDGVILELFDEYDPQEVVIEDVCRNLSGIRSNDGIFWLVATQVIVTMYADFNLAKIKRIPPGTLRSYMGIVVLKKTNAARESTKKQFVRIINDMGFFEKPLLQKQHNIAVAVSLGVMHLGIKDKDVKEKVAG